MTFEAMRNLTSCEREGIKHLGMKNIKQEDFDYANIEVENSAATLMVTHRLTRETLVFDSNMALLEFVISPEEF